MLVFDRVQISSFFFACLSFFSLVYIPIEAFGTGILTRILPLCFLVAVFFCLPKKSLFINKYDWLLVLLIVSTAIGSFREMKTILFWMNYVVYIFYYFVLISAITQFGSVFLYIHLKFLAYFLSAAGFLAFCQFYLYELFKTLYIFRDTPYFESKGQVASLYSNPNILGVMSAFAIFLVIGIRKQYLISRIMFLVLICCCGLGVIYSGSRMALALVILLLCFYTVSKLGVIFSKISFIFLLFLMSVLSYGYSQISAFIDLNFRDVVWSGVYRVWLSDAFFGVGLGGVEGRMSDILHEISWVQGPNNFYWGYLAEAGLVSMLLLMIHQISIVLHAEKSDHSKSAIGILCAIFVSQYSEFFFNYVSIFLIVYYNALAWARLSTIERFDVVPFNKRFALTKP